MTIKRVACLYDWPIPSRAADTMHIMKMCAAFQEIGWQTTLYSARASSAGVSIGDLWEHYGIETPFGLEQAQPLPAFRRHDLALRFALRAYRSGVSLVYARSLLGAMWSAVLGIPTIYDSHGPPGERLGQHYCRLLITRPAFKRLVVITTPLRQMYLDRFDGLLPPEKIHIDPNGVELHRFRDLPSTADARRRIGLPADGFVAGYTGHLYPGRGIQLIFDLAERLPEAHFLLAGGHEEDIARWRLQLQNRKLSNVHMVGFVPNAALPTYLAASDVLLMPYQRRVSVHGSDADSAAYMSPMKMFEYMAAERLIISSDLPVLRDVLSERNAVLCDPEDAAAWERAIRLAMGSPDRAGRLARQARRDVEEHTWQRRAQRVLDGIV